MKVTYIGHSGFAVETEQHILVFDYYTGEVPAFDPAKQIYVFSSHRHADHFNPAILDWEKQYPNIHYFLSSDINTRPMSYITFLDRNQTLSEKDITVETLESTDEGVAFLIAVDGHSIYHAGDLNWWTWAGEESPQEYEQMTSRFQREMEKIRGRHFDLAFMLLDPRQGDRYGWGMDYFLQTVDAPVVFPMHFWNDYSVISRFCQDPSYCRYSSQIRQITRPGETFTV